MGKPGPSGRKQGEGRQERTRIRSETSPHKLACRWAAPGEEVGHGCSDPFCSTRPPGLVAQRSRAEFGRGRSRDRLLDSSCSQPPFFRQMLRFGENAVRDDLGRPTTTLSVKRICVFELRASGDFRVPYYLLGSASRYLGKPVWRTSSFLRLLMGRSVLISAGTR